MTYNTGNALGSSDVRDLKDNTENIDKFANGPDQIYLDRFSQSRKSLKGIEQQVTDFLIAQGYESVFLAYGAAVVVERQTQLVQKDAELYRAKNAADVPLTLTGVWATDAPKLQAVGDAVLRQQLASSTGATKIGHGNTTVASELPRSFDYFGATGTPDDTLVMQSALDSGVKRLVAKAGRTYKFTTLTMATAGQCIFIEPGAVLEALTPTARSITVSGEGCFITGGGTIKGQPVFNGANERPTYATVWVTGNGITIDGVTFDTTPKEAVMFEDSTYHAVTNCRFFGRYPYDSYDENSTTNHCAIMSNIPASASHSDPWLLVTGNHFEGYIQGCLVANYGSAGNNSGVLIDGNTFRDCWDHGIYLSRGLSPNVSNNSFLRCRRPIVADGIGSVIIGNTLYAGTAAGSNREQSISVREASYSIVANNTIYGFDASILVDCLETTTMNGNLIINNIIRSTGTSFITCGIRLGVGATECDNNTIAGNRIHSGFFGALGAAIELTMLSGFANNTRVMNNDIRRIDGGGFGINATRHSYAQIKNNSLTFSGSAAVATQTNGIYIDNSTFPAIEDNSFYYVIGGASITFRGISIGATCAIPKIRDNTFMCTSASLVLFTPYALGSISDVTGGVLNPNAQMTGSFTWTSGTPSYIVGNLNVLPTSKVTITPKNAGAAAVLRDLGFYIVCTTAGFTIFTAGGGNTTSSSEWDFVIR